MNYEETNTDYFKDGSVEIWSTNPNVSIKITNEQLNALVQHANNSKSK